MNLLYIWTQVHTGAGGSEAYLLSSKYQITFFRQEGRLSIHRRGSLSDDGFWGDHIYDVMAVVGSNGAGKTQLAYSIMETLDEASRLSESAVGFQQSRFPFLLVFEDNRGGGSEIRIYAEKLQFSVDTELRCELHPRWDNLRRFKFAYFTDTLSPADYRQTKYGVVHDGSLGGGIRKTFKHYQEMHYTNNTMSPITTYFDDEMGKILEFICMDQNRENVPFILPKIVTFTPKDYQTNLDYISGELKHMGKPDGRDILRKKCDEIQNTYGLNMCSTLSIHLMLDAFKASCIPQTSSDSLEAKAEIFLKALDQFKCRGETAFDMALELLELLTSIGDPDLIHPYINMVQWLKEQPALRDSANREMWSFDLRDEQQTVKDLYRLYCETKFPYPYFSISFGLSTGEYALLRRFVRINELLGPDFNGRACVINNLVTETKCDGLMLYFDEADQSLHPDWQRKYLDWLLQFVSARFKTCKVQLAAATHSPILLSDIPRGNVLYLQNSGEGPQAEQREVRTFGSNIHTLFRDAFFLHDGTMGAFAERKINEAARSLRDLDGQAPPETERLIEEIGDDVIRNKLQQMYRNSPPQRTRRTDRQAVEETIHLLRFQVKHLEAAIRELENTRYD